MLICLPVSWPLLKLCPRVGLQQAEVTPGGYVYVCVRAQAYLDYRQMRYLHAAELENEAQGGWVDSPGSVWGPGRF